MVSAPVAFSLTVPLSNDSSLDCPVDIGGTLFVLGANGTGKSNLMHSFYSANLNYACRISAHRQTWFFSGATTVSPEERRLKQTQIQSFDGQQDARWSDHFSQLRPSIAIYDLIDAENVRARAIARAVDDGKMDVAKTLAKDDAPMRIVNELLQSFQHAY